MNYLYNEVEFPQLPKWDTKKYKYAVIRRGAKNLTDVELYVFDKPVDIVKPAYQFDFAGVTQTVAPRMEYTNGIYSCAWQLIDFCWRPLQRNYTPYDSDEISNPIWCNYPLYNEGDGTIYMDKSEPVPIPDGTIVPYPEAYWYNDVEAPPLPADVDRAEYPYVCMGVYWADEGKPFALYLYYTKKPMVIYDSFEGATWIGNEGDTAMKYECKCYYNTDGPTREWMRTADYDVVVEKPEWAERPYALLGVATLHWTDYEISTPDGELYLAKSPEPVRSDGSVYFPPCTLDSTSFMQGYIVGRRLAGMRK